MFRHLKHRRVLENFQKINQIPRCSNHEEKISKFLYDKITGLGLECIQEKCGNIIAQKPASAGYESHKGVILQAHMDMVCVKSDDSKHDFDKDPIELILDGDILRANKTTLGADNGIGVAMMLTILEDNGLVHPPLTCFITIAEETGMDGAILADYSLIKGDRLINLDSEEDTSITISCSGGSDLSMFLNLEYENINKYKPNTAVEAFSETKAFQISISGITGGHSGIDINKNGISAIKALGRMLLNLGYGRLFEISAGSKRNAIPVFAQCKLVANTKLEQLKSITEQMQAVFRDEYSKKDPNVTIEVSEIEVPNQIFSQIISDKIINAINLIPHGVAAMTQHMENLVETSSNFAIIEQTDDKRLGFYNSIRSSKKTKIDELINRMALIAKLFGMEYKISDGYPAWEHKTDNELIELVIPAYREVYGKVPEVISIHAGLECAFFAQKFPQMDMISFGPNIYNPHTIDEHTEISSVEKNYEFLLEALKRL